MQNFYLINYLKQNVSIEPEILDSLKMVIDESIYFYGENFKYPKEIYQNKKKIFKIIRDLTEPTLMSFNLRKSKINLNQKLILSNAYFSVNEELERLGYLVYKPVWSLPALKLLIRRQYYFYPDYNIYRGAREITKILNGNLEVLLRAETISKIEKFRIQLKESYKNKNLKALIMAFDMPFFENISIQVFKELQKPSFIFLHGLPGVYNLIDNNRADFLVVWGEKIKENFVKSGIPAKKIFVSGHPNYKNLSIQDLRFALENVLVISKSPNWVQYGDDARLIDRGNMILYVYSIQKVLKQLGVKSARLRPHPSENGIWYLKYIDNGFWKIDNESLPNSLKKSSLVIGPTSTVLFEATYLGVNYVIYEPNVNNIDVSNYPLVPPFDGSDKRIPVAMNEDQLKTFVEQKVKVDLAYFHDYIKTPFDLSFIKEIIN